MEEYCSACRAPRKVLSMTEYSDGNADMILECGHRLIARTIEGVTRIREQLGMRMKSGKRVRGKPAREMKARMKEDEQVRFDIVRTIDQPTVVRHRVWKDGKLIHEDYPSERTELGPKKDK